MEMPFRVTIMQGVEAAMSTMSIAREEGPAFASCFSPQIVMINRIREKRKYEKNDN